MKYAAITVVLVALLAGIGGCGFVCYQTDIKPGEETVTVEGKERIAEDQDGKWLVYGTDGQTFQVADNLFYWMFDATDRYREFVVGQTYDCRTIGVRWHFTSSYKNLHDCEAVTP